MAGPIVNLAIGERVVSLLDVQVQSARVEVGELRDVLEFLEHHQLFPNDERWLKAKNLADEAENLSETIKKKLDQISRYPWKRVMTLIKYGRMGKELGRVMREIQLILTVGRLYFDVFSTSKDTRWRVPKSSSSVRNGTQKCADAYYALEQLEFVLQKAEISVHHEVYKEITSLKAQLLPMLDLLNDIKSTQEIDNRQRVWMQILQTSFESIGNEFNVFKESADSTDAHLSKLEGTILQRARKFCNFILQKRNEICKIWNRYHTYRIGAFEGLDGSRLVVDHNLSLRVGDKLKVKDMEELQIDLLLMKALMQDSNRMEGPDERENIWVKQMKDIQLEMETVNGRFRTAKWYELSKQYMNFKHCKRVQRLEETLYHVSMRPRFYSMGSPELRHATANECRLFQESWKMKDKIQSVKRELQLMEGMFKDVKTIGQLDVRLKVWIEEMHCVAQEAKEIIQKISNGTFTSKVASLKIRWIGTRISDISEWSLYYGIEEVRARNLSSSRTQELEETSPYPKDAVEEQVDLIRREVRMLQALDSDITMMDRFNGGSLQAWVQELREVSSEAGTLISTYNKPETLRNLSLSYFNKKLQMLKNVSQKEEILKSDHFCTRSQVVRNVARMKDKIQKLHQRRREYGIQHFDRKYSNIAVDLKARLFSDDNDNFTVIPILSAWDKDKVFLQEFINEDHSIASRFSQRVWLTVGEEETAVACLEYLYNKVSEQIIQSAGEELINNRYLVVVYEVQNSVVWNSLRKLMQITSSGSRIIFTTCHVEAHCTGFFTSNVVLELDSDELPVGIEYPVFHPIRMRVLPQQKNIPQLGMVLREHDEVSQMSNLSVESLPSYLRECLYYFLLFPSKDPKGKDIYIPIRRLIGIWVAEGMVSPKRDTKDVPIELVAEGYLSELIKLSMIEVKVKNGKIRRCRLKDDQQLRESCLIKAREYDFFQSKNGNSEEYEYFGVPMGNIYRLTDIPVKDDSNACYSHIHYPINHPVILSSHYKKVRSFLSFDIEERIKPGEYIGNFLEKAISKRCFLSLRVLDLEHIFRPVLPEELSKLILLRYLGLRWTYLEALPPFVSDLLNLQVLDVKHTYITKLPKSLWRMQYLRHLYLSETYRSRFDGKPSSSRSLKNLQTLWGAFVDEDSPVEGGLDTLQNVRKLGLLCRSMYDKRKMASQLEAVANWIVVLKDLESLRLKSQDEKGKPSDLYLKPLSAHVNLSMLHLVGILKYPSIISDLPLNLTEVTLSGCELEDDPLHSMEYLPRLVSLMLFSNASKSKLMQCSSRGFAKLEILKIWKMEHLEELIVTKGGMLLIKDLEFRSCANLKKQPEGLQHVCKMT
ncbi:antimicrobial response protein [Lithospermum erythrorhizon]|uniref:Antimicrobial response protein n=1 Tax=Lithospermum erythrorhizon TaxID=34254 RepID=A0AAV3PXV1_LITER